MEDTTIGMRIRQARKYLDLSARQLGESLGMTESWKNVYHWENGVSDVPDIYYLEFMKLGINPTWLLTGTGSPYADNKAGLALMQKRGHTSIPESVVAGAQAEEMGLQPPVDARKAMGNYLEDKASIEEKVFLLEKATIGLSKISDSHDRRIGTVEVKSEDHERRIGRLEANLN